MYLKLVRPNKKYLPSVKEAINEYISNQSEFEIHAVTKMIEAAENDFNGYLKNTENERLGINLKPGYVSHTVFWLIDGDEYIGTFDLRHSLTPYLKNIGGHIAYQIRPDKCHKGYAYAGLMLCLDEAAKIGIDEVLITCKQHNIASYAIMHKALQNVGGNEDIPFDDNGVINKRVWLKTARKQVM